jgi:peptidoglycan/LPS O-acetylase OafA/YrhL
MYIIAWTVVIFLSLLFILKWIMPQRDMGGWTSFYIVLPLSILSAALTTHLVYETNEKKVQRLIEKQHKENGKNQ